MAIILNYNLEFLTKTTVNGAKIGPTCPTIAQVFMIVVRRFVGHCSAVKTYRQLNAVVILVLLSRKKTSTIVECSSGMNGVAMIEIDAIDSAENNNVRRFIRFSNGKAIKTPGISAATTTIKLM